MVENHDDAGGPEGGKDGGDGEQDGSGLACGIATEAEIALPPELIHNDRVQDEEDGAGNQIHGEAVDPDEDVVHGGTDVVLSPDVGPPVIGNAGQEASDIDTDNDFPGAGWVGDSVVFQWVADGDIPVNG